MRTFTQLDIRCANAMSHGWPTRTDACGALRVGRAMLVPVSLRAAEQSLQPTDTSSIESAASLAPLLSTEDTDGINDATRVAHS